MSFTIRDAVPEDSESLLSIYGYYVLNTAISFEYTVPSPEEFRTRIETTLSHFPYLVAERDGRVIGYAYAAPFHTRAACAHCAEVSLYIDKNERRSGIGRALYEQLENRLSEIGIEIIYASIALPREWDDRLDTNSRDFHAHMGFDEVAHFNRCGKKFGKYYDLIFMEKVLIKNNKNRH